MVIKIADRLHQAISDTGNRCNHFFGARFAIASGDANRREAKLIAIAVGKQLQAGQGIRDLDLRQCPCLWIVFTNQGAARTSLLNHGQKLVSVESVAVKRNKKFPRPDSSRIGGDPSDRSGTGSVKFPTHPLRDLFNRSRIH